MLAIHQRHKVKEKPILFSRPMVRAILEGRKTQTRRIVKPQPTREFRGCAIIDVEEKCPYGKPGDRLWVRETFQIVSNYHADYRDDEPPFNDGRPVYRNDDPDYPYWEQCYYAATEQCPELLSVNSDEMESKWRPSIHMPRWASRIDLEITDVRVERLQEISEADAKAEGAKAMDIVSGRQTLDPNSRQGSHRAHLRVLWESINGPGSWSLNPWVWVLEFKRVK